MLLSSGRLLPKLPSKARPQKPVHPATPVTYNSKVPICLNAADPSGRAVYGAVVRPLACSDCGSEFRRQRKCLSLVSVVCCQIEVPASGWSLFQRSPTECGVSECDGATSIMRRHWLIRGCCVMKRMPKRPLANLMFFWPCIMNWLYINYQLDALTIIYS